MIWGGVGQFFLGESQSHIYSNIYIYIYVCAKSWSGSDVPNLVAVRRSCRKKGRVQTDTQTHRQTKGRCRGGRGGREVGGGRGGRGEVILNKPLLSLP